MTADGRYLASASDDATAKIWDALTGAEVTTLKGKHIVNTCVGDYQCIMCEHVHGVCVRAICVITTLHISHIFNNCSSQRCCDVVLVNNFQDIRPLCSAVHFIRMDN